MPTLDELYADLATLERIYSRHPTMSVDLEIQRIENMIFREVKP